MTRVHRMLAAALIVTSLAALESLGAQAPNPQVGTWKLNAAKSKYDPGPVPQSQTLKIEPWEQGLKIAVEIVDPKGAKAQLEFAAKFDGKPYPFKGNPDADMVTLKQVDARTIETVWTLKGKPTITTRATVSADGKTRSVTQTGVNASGQKVNHIVVYERQM